MNSSGVTFVYKMHIRSSRRRSTPGSDTECAAGEFEWHNRAVANTRKPKPLGDIAAVCGKDEQGLHILRRRSPDGPVEAGVVRPLVEGKAIAGEVVSLRPREDVPFLFDVKTELEAPAPAEPSTHGPAQVATESYRRGWDAIWGSRPRATRPN